MTVAPLHHKRIDTSARKVWTCAISSAQVVGALPRRLWLNSNPSPGTCLFQASLVITPPSIERVNLPLYGWGEVVTTNCKLFRICLSRLRVPVII